MGQMGCTCRMRTSPSSYVLLLLLFTALILKPQLTLEEDTIFPGQSLTGNQTLVSKEGSFGLGFFSPGNSRNYYIGIWYKNISVQTIVWVANREKPVASSSSSELKISQDGNLVLLDQSKNQIWSTNLTSSSLAVSTTVAVLLDTGNLVLVNYPISSATLWQSFDHPTNTWLPGSKLGLNKVTGENMLITSWRSYEDPAPGPFSLGIDPDGTDQYFGWWNGVQKYYTSGLWNGLIFSSNPEMSPTSHVYQFNHVTNDRENYFTYTIRDQSLISGFVMDVDGQVKQSIWVNSTKTWTLFYSKPRQHCEVYALCGVFSVCDNAKVPFCYCLPGFKPASPKEWDLSDFGGGCVRKTPLQCGKINGSNNGNKDVFISMPNLKWPVTYVQALGVANAKECELACLSNCSCNAYSFTDRCLIWRGDLLNVQGLSDGVTNGSILHVRVAGAELPSKHKKPIKVVFVVAVAGAVGISMSIMSICILIAAKRIGRGRVAIAKKLESGSLVVFGYSYLRQATSNFSQKLGRGGFGCVFKGVLPDMTPFAVKKLEGIKQGEKQFRTEVTTLGTIQHVNLVRLLGFCSESKQRLLVYEYMPKGSLDSFLFGEQTEFLDWSRRYQMMLGIARGLAYLHEECRDCIIHCDVKPENILLDDNFCPKIADFGMAKLIGRDFSRALTTMRGTIGYLSPEWILGLAITCKADVYSYGMMLFEIISGRRNTRPRKDRAIPYFPLWAAHQIKEGKLLCLLDERLDGNAEMRELTVACRVASWCIQDNQEHRPFMSQVARALEGVLEVNVPPVPISLQNLMGSPNDGDDEDDDSIHMELEKEDV